MKRFGEKTPAQKESGKKKKEENTALAVFSCVASLATTIAFAVYNAYLGAIHSSAWNVCITVYYVFLAAERAFLLFARVQRAKGKTQPQCERERKEYLAQSAFLFAIDLVLIAPVTLMIFQERTINYTTVSAISFAAYATYKIIAAAVKSKKAKATDFLFEKAQRSVNLIDALVSVLSLQYVLVMTESGGIDGDMTAVCATGSFLLFVATLAVAAVSLKDAVKVAKNRNSQPYIKQ